METKEELVNNIKEWLKINSEIDDLKKQIKEKNNVKKNLTENLVIVMKTNKIDCFDMNDGALVYKKNKIKKTINGKTLLSVLKNYYKADINTAEELSKYIMDNREEQTKEIIKYKINK